MPKFIELMTTEHNIEIRILSMFIMKSFEICPSCFLFACTCSCSWFVDM